MPASLRRRSPLWGWGGGLSLLFLALQTAFWILSSACLDRARTARAGLESGQTLRVTLNRTVVSFSCEVTIAWEDSTLADPDREG